MTPIAHLLTPGILAPGAVEDKKQTAETTEIDHTDQEHPNAHETVTMTATTSATAVVVDDEMIAEIGTTVEVMDGEMTRAEMTEAGMVSGIWTGMVTGGNTEMIEVLETMTEVKATEGETGKATRSAEAEARVENVPVKENQLQMLRTQIWPE